ncbi:hypothetical protein [Gramella sp. AN32]|uniref:Uncharacterized protein n=1 Tax=Christiangramia antarctica TaxID=2058158 RepID=A0ABW5X314_9FLAO|nr:hypothetical protein [Gramella sp. AN32]
MHNYPEDGQDFSFGLEQGYLSIWTDRLKDGLQKMNSVPANKPEFSK